MRIAPCLAVLALLAAPSAGPAAVWKAAGQVGLTGIQAEMDDANTPAAVMIRVENFSKIAPVPVSRLFIQMNDNQKNRLRPIPPDELVSRRLERLRQLLPEHVREVNGMLGEIKADYPQEKLIAAYGRLREFMARGRPMDWRSGLENWLGGVHPSTPAEIAEANRLIEEIGDIARNYLWPRDVAPQTVYTGMVFFSPPLQGPPFIFFEVGEEFVGWPMTLAASRRERKTPGP